MKRALLSMVAFAVTTTAALAQAPGQAPTQAQVQAQAAAALRDLSAPTEVGTTVMPAGNYIVTEQTSGKCYVLMVTGKGMMILSPAPTGVTAAQATPQAAAQIQATTPPAAAPVLGGAGSSMASAAMKGLVNKGISKGVGQLLNTGSTKSLTKYIPK